MPQSGDADRRCAGAAIGSISGQAGQGAAIGAGTGLLFGGTNAAYAGGYASYDWQRRYDNAYVQCMYAKGNQVPVRAGYRSGMPSVLRWDACGLIGAIQ